MRNIVTTLLLFISLQFFAQAQDVEYHVVQLGETLFGISRKYDMSVDQLLNLNPYLRIERMELGDTLHINKDAVFAPRLQPEKEQPPFDVELENGQRHIVKDQETLYSLSKKYNISVKSILAYNPNIEPNVIRVSDTLVIPLNVIMDESNNTGDSGNMADDATNTMEGNFMHVINQGETLYGISKRYEVPLEKLIELNPGLDTEVIGFGDTLVVDNTKEAISILPSSSNLANPTNPRNGGSVGIEVQMDPIVETPQMPGTAFIDEDKRVVHVVKAGETLYRLSKQYSTSIPNLVRWNDLPSTDLKEGQQLIISISDQETAQETLEPAPKDEDRIAIHEIDYSKLKPIEHTVEDGETLEVICRKYNQKIEIVRKWNDIGEDNVLPTNRKEIIVGWYLPKASSSVQPKMTSAGQESEFRSAYQRRNQDQLNYKMIKKRSKGTWLRDNTSFDKNFYALHRTAPPKSYLRVLNPMNNKTVYVKVIGKLPDTGENSDVDIKLTYAAVKKLGLRDEKFVVDWSYPTLKNK